MTDPQYQEHFKNLGKIARLWDDASFDKGAMQLLASRLFDQLATGEVDSYEAMTSPWTSSGAWSMP